MCDLPDLALVRITKFNASTLGEFYKVATLDSIWRAVAFDASLRATRQQLAREICLPGLAEQLLLSNPALHCDAFKNTYDWLAFCARQVHIQGVFAGTYGGTHTPENLPPDVNADIFDWEEQHTVSVHLESLSVKKNCRGVAVRRTYADEEPLPGFCGEYEWLVLDRRRTLDNTIWECLFIFHGSSPQQPAEQWEDGNLLCGVRGPFDFRPAVDPSFLDLSPFIVLLVPYPGACDHWLTWAPRLFAPCAWMFPKQAHGQKRQAEKLDLWAGFRDERVVSALVLGNQLEKPVTYDSIEVLLEMSRQAKAEERVDQSVGKVGGCAVQAASSRRKGGRRSKVGTAEPRDYRSGKNPKGLQLFIPRPRLNSDHSGTVRARARGGSNASASASGASHQPARDSILSCSVSAPDFLSFLKEHMPSLRHAEQLCLYVGDAARRDLDYDSAGLLEDAARLERCNAFSHACVIDLARKWNCLAGKWLLFVPIWHVDALFELAASRLRDGSFEGCTRLVVSPPGAFGTDSDKFMLSMHCNDFTDKHQVMSLGKALRATARQGIRAPSGTWGELQDDPFARREKKAALVFKPEVFTCLTLHRNNPYGIKTTLYTIDL